MVAVVLMRPFTSNTYMGQPKSWTYARLIGASSASELTRATAICVGDPVTRNVDVQSKYRTDQLSCWEIHRQFSI